MGKPGFPIPLRKSQALTFPRARVWGNPVSPHPCSSSLCSPQVSMRLRRTPAGCTCACSWEGRAFTNPPTGWEDGETRFSHPPARVAYVHLSAHPVAATSPLDGPCLAPPGGIAPRRALLACAAFAEDRVGHPPTSVR